MDHKGTYWQPDRLVAHRRIIGADQLERVNKALAESRQSSTPYPTIVQAGPRAPRWIRRYGMALFVAMMLAAAVLATVGIVLLRAR
jgi:hypothetical protein